MNDYKARIETILLDMETSVQSSHAAIRKQATASLLKLLTEARIEALEAAYGSSPTGILMMLAELKGDQDE